MDIAARSENSLKDEQLLIQALTHPSYLNEHPEGEIGDNQRLGSLGDAVAAFLAGEWLFTTSRMSLKANSAGARAALVRTETLARHCVEVWYW